MLMDMGTAVTTPVCRSMTIIFAPKSLNNICNPTRLNSRLRKLVFDWDQMHSRQLLDNKVTACESTTMFGITDIAAAILSSSLS